MYVPMSISIELKEKKTFLRKLSRSMYTLQLHCFQIIKSRMIYNIHHIEIYMNMNKIKCRYYM